MMTYEDAQAHQEDGVDSHEHEEIRACLQRSGISSGDIYRLCCLLESPDATTVELAGLVLQVALMKPMREGRTEYLQKYRPGLLASLQQAGLEPQ